MPKFLIIYKDGELANSVTFEHSDNVSPYCKFLRDLGHTHYEVYIYDEGMGYIRTTRFQNDD